MSVLATGASACKPINYLGVRGSSEAPQGFTPAGSTYQPGTANNGMGGPIESQFTALRQILESLGEADDIQGAGIVYPAIPVPDYLFDSDAYLESVNADATNLCAELRAINRVCEGESTKIILAGYSQGSDVIDTAAAAVQRQHNTTDFKNVASIVYFGHPSRIGGQLPDLSDTNGKAHAGSAAQRSTLKQKPGSTMDSTDRDSPRSAPASTSSATPPTNWHEVP